MLPKNVEKHISIENLGSREEYIKKKKTVRKVIINLQPNLESSLQNFYKFIIYMEIYMSNLIKLKGK